MTGLVIIHAVLAIFGLLAVFFGIKAASDIRVSIGAAYALTISGAVMFILAGLAIGASSP